ncbi:MAG: redoxin domain-containing protein [Deltaproteobacteria bacterium]|nr:redoxin domain-containing protein [Candidatus Zymogenaceae bacterium]
MTPFNEKIYAPDFPTELDWLNTERPLTIDELRGKVVLLDFWTYCCINCIHVIGDLKMLEEKYPDELVVIGVHSAKFTAEGETDNIRQAILRYEIEHPVINDSNMILWRSYGVHAWPTVVLIAPDGTIVGSRSGEGVFAALDSVITRVIEDYDAVGLIDRSPIPMVPESMMAADTPLLFPGKVLAHEESGRLFIADSNHNRILVLSLSDHSLIDVIGGGTDGFTDGSFETATFFHPQGMVADGDALYIADTENHAIRKADLNERTVVTVAGTGRQGFSVSGEADALSTNLNSPWDLALVNGTLYIAMAGPHQLWRMDLNTGRITVHAGSGREGRLDGKLSFASLAQPSGLTTDGEKLYFADSEISAIRSADIDPTGKVDTIVGGDLFDFGDTDGTGLSARLQHPLGVAYHDRVLYVADTYNNKIKRVDIAARTITTFAGTGATGGSDGTLFDATFDEPAGVTYADGRLYVADTNNHLIRIIDITNDTVSTLSIPDIAAAHPEDSPAVDTKPVRLSPLTTGPGEGTITLVLPEGYTLTESAPSYLDVTLAGNNTPKTADGTAADTISLSPESFPLTVPIALTGGEDEIILSGALYLCTEADSGTCIFVDVNAIIPIIVRPDDPPGRIEASLAPVFPDLP